MCRYHETVSSDSFNEGPEGAKARDKEKLKQHPIHPNVPILTGADYGDELKIVEVTGYGDLFEDS